MKLRRRGSFTQRAVSLAVTSVVVAALFAGVGAAPAAANHGPVECATPMPVDQLRQGMIATGYTVERGRDPIAFEVEILGVLRDGIGPGRDLIVVDTRGPAVERAGGIWYGMSGSPVYFDDKLVGAIAYGLSFGPSSVAGLTPAEDMLKVLGYPPTTEDPPTLLTTSGDSGDAGGAALPDSISIPAATRKTIASESGTSESQVGDDMDRLRTPVSVSGLTSHAMAKLESVIERENLPLIPYVGSSSSTTDQAALPGAVKPGGNFAAALSYGDITFAGIGTTSYVCNGVALAFGHPFFYYPEGPTRLGASDADAIVIVDDPTFGPYKLASVEERAGVVDQDRFAGIRALLGEVLATIPITSTVTSLDSTTSRTGTTESVNSEFTPFLAFIHVLANIDMVFDRIGEGSSALSWKITGTREDGSAWEFSRDNLYVSQYDISYESVFELETQLYTLLYNDFEDVRFTDIDVTADVKQAVEAYKITKVLVSKNGGSYRDVRRVRVRRGARIGLRVVLETVDDAASERRVDLAVRVPRRARTDGMIQITSGAASYEELFCFVYGEKCADETGNKIDSFDEMLAFLESRPKNNEAVARLMMGRRGRVVSSDSELLDKVVKGRKRVHVRVVGARRASGGGEGKVVSCPVMAVSSC